MSTSLRPTGAIEADQVGCTMAEDTALLLREFLRSPSAVGAIAPSSRRLAEAVVAPIPERGDPVVVELGSGTGVFTRAIQARLNARGRHLAVELNPRLAELTADRHPAVEVVCGSAENLPAILAGRGLTQADLVVSGLPWVAFPPHLQAAILDAASSVLAPSGVFTTFGYAWVRGSASARRFRRLLATRYEEVVAGRTVLANLPPAFVYHARRPRSAYWGLPA